LFLPQFNEYFFFIVPSLIIYSSYGFFFKINNNTHTINSNNSTNNINNLGCGLTNTYINFYMYIVVFNFLYFFSTKGVINPTWFNHLNINNLFLYFLYFFTIVGFLFYTLLKQITKKKKIIKSLDFLLSVSSLIFLLPYLFCVNTIFTLLFLLELLSGILFYKLISSKIWYKNNNTTKSIGNNLPQNYINMIFFQYWVTFFSTIFIIYFYINVYYLFGTSD
jgi:hypothetical protein